MKNTLAAILLLAPLLLWGTACSDDGGGAGSDAAAEGGAQVIDGVSIVPLLLARPSDADFRGAATLEPDEPVPVGHRGTWSITYTADGPGIAPGGFVMLQISLFWGWTRPQLKHEDFEGYVRVTPSFDDSSLDVIDAGFNRILVVSRKRGIRPGESVTFRYTDGVADRFAEREELFQILVDADADGHCATLPSSPVIRTLPRQPVRLAVSAPQQARPGDTVEITIAGLDIMGNWAVLPGGARFRAAVERDGEAAGEFEMVAAGGAGDGVPEPQVLRHSVTLPGEPGVYFVGVRGAGVEADSAGGFAADVARLQGRSNPLLCREGERKLNLYFGDIHGHTRLSDGSGTPEDYYLFARDVAGLDVAALTDHDTHGTFPIEGAPWERIKRVTNDAYAPGRFVTFLGYEWTNWEFGHRNVYYRGGEGEIFSCLDERSRTPEGLWECLAPYEAMTIAHHTGGGPVPVDWTRAPGGLESVVEICSIHGSSESYGCRSMIYQPVEGAFVFDALNRGYRLGVIGSGDTHNCHPGLGDPNAVTSGVFGVFASELTREAVWDAIERRHVYGTSGPKIILFAQVAESPMGSQLEWTKDSVPVAVQAVGCSDLESVDIVRNGELVFSQPCDGVEAVLLVEDSAPLPGASWYLVRVVQKDGNMAWSSPVWVQRPEAE